MKSIKITLPLLILLVIISINACSPAGAVPKTAEVTELPISATVGEMEFEATDTPAHEEGEQGHKIPVIFSHDGAPDDIAAMLYISKHPDIEVIGVVNSYGEQDPQASSKAWATFIHEILNLNAIPFAVGAEKPLDPAGYEFPAGWRAGANGFWSLELPVSTPVVDPREGYELIVDLINGSPEKVTLLVTGAQTDMALALEQDPQIKDNIERIVIMGGAFHVKGNLGGNAGAASNDVAEWNIFVDATAADQVFNSSVPLTIMPLDGSENFWITREMCDQLAGSDDPGAQLLAQQWENQFERWGGDFLLWDILAAVAVTNPEYFTWENGNVDVITEIGSQHGQTIVLDNTNENNQFAVDNMTESLKTHILDIYLER